MRGEKSTVDCKTCACQTSIQCLKRVIDVLGGESKDASMKKSHGKDSYQGKGEEENF